MNLPGPHGRVGTFCDSFTTEALCRAYHTRE